MNPCGTVQDCGKRCQISGVEIGALTENSHRSRVPVLSMTKASWRLEASRNMSFMGVSNSMSYGMRLNVGADPRPSSRVFRAIGLYAELIR